jgi:hypothetical protein
MSHVIIIRRGHFFKLEMWNRSDRQVRSAENCEQVIKQIMLVTQDEAKYDINSLTCANRDVWADVSRNRHLKDRTDFQTREHLCRLSPSNRDHLKDIDTAVCVIVLTDEFPQSECDVSCQMFSKFQIKYKFLFELKMQFCS